MYPLFLLVPPWLNKEHGLNKGHRLLFPWGVLSKCRSISVDNLLLRQKNTKVQADRENEEKEWEAYIVLAGGNIVSSTTADT